MSKKPKLNRLNFEEQKQRFSLTLVFSAVVFAILLVALALAGVAVGLLVKFEVIGSGDNLKVSHIIILMVIISAVMGTSITILTGRFPLKPVNNLINKMNRLAAGDFKTRLHFRGPIYNHPAFNEISESFNKMAEQLENTEVLRSDFINNFSHEFKTPIVSIAGFAKLLKKGNLSEEQKWQYLDAIEEESMRLSYMATNVLNLTKVENQTILTVISKFNLSEQVRSAVLLLENKWEKKNLELGLDFDEYIIEANEELLKQVWINLLDNAVKFAPRCGMVTVGITEKNNLLTVTVSNTGSEIPPEKLEKIWNKFYQADESHSSEGNGIGLVIVKRVTELHGGHVSVESKNSITSFTVTLPKEQN